MATNEVQTDAREPRRLSEALRDSEERARLAAEVGRVGIWEWDLSEDHHVWDETCSTLYYGQPGYCPVSLTAFLNLVHPADRDRVRTEIHRAIETCGEFRCEYRVLWPDGSVHYILAQARTVCRSAEQPVNLIGVARDVTERKQADEALRIVNRRLATSLGGMAKLHEIATRLVRVTRPAELLDEILWAAIELSVAQAGMIQLRDKATGRLTLVAHQGLGPQFLDAFHTVEEGRAACGTALKTKTRVIIEDVTADLLFAGTPLLDVLRAAGIRAMQSTPLLDREGRVVGVLSTHYRVRCRPTAYQLRLLDLLARQAADFIERTAAQEALRESESRFRGTFDNAAVGITHIDPQGNWLRVNDKFCEMVGYSREALVGTEFSAITHPDDAKGDWRQYRRLMTGEIDSYLVEKRYIHGNGQIRWALIYRTAQPDEAGRPAYSISVVVDITEQKRAEAALQNARDELEVRVQERTGELQQTVEALHQSEAKFTTMFQIVPTMIGFTRLRDGLIFNVNDAMVAASGYTREELVGHTTKELKIWVDYAQRERISEILQKGRTLNGEVVLRRKDGQLRSVLYSACKMVVDGEDCILYALTDISERKRTEEALKVSNEELARRTAELQATVEELRRSNEDLERFAYISSHDLQEPVRNVGMYVSKLAHLLGDTLDDQTAEALQFAQEGAVRISTLIKDLLEYSRVNTQGRPPAPTDTGAVLRRVLKGMQLAIQETKAQVVYDGLPTVPADATQLGQVFQNLIENALKYRKDTEPPVIEVRAEFRDGQWLFSVKDNGIGIDPKHHDQVFVAFKRLHANRSRYPGTGIGLAIVKRIIERHHGRVCVESKPGEGSTFYFTLPMNASKGGGKSDDHIDAGEHPARGGQ